MGWGDSDSAEILVVSGDKGVQDACDPVDYLHPSEKIQEMLDDVADDDEKLAEFLREQVKQHEDEIAKKVSTEFEDRYFYVLDESGDAEVKEAKMEEVDILEVGDKEAVVEVSFHLDYKAYLSYDDPDMMSYDNETGDTMSWVTKHETVDRTGWARAEVRASFDGLDPK